MMQFNKVNELKDAQHVKIEDIYNIDYKSNKENKEPLTNSYHQSEFRRKKYSQTRYLNQDSKL